VALGILGNKVGMTRIFDENGYATPVTAIRVGPCVITQIKTEATDGYNAVQLGYSEVSQKSINRPELGHLVKAGLPPLKYLHEYKVKDLEEFSLAQVVTTDIFKEGQLVDVTGKSIGKGFVGLQKRYNFSRGPMTHGSKNHRAPGSIGMGTTPGRVYKGKKMAGHLGNKKITVTNLEIIKIESDKNILLVKGAIPGKPGNLVSLKPALSENN
jgi:large subunit ribosomal protein L3